MRSVFVVEDSPTVRLMVKAMLKKAGFHIAGEAETGEEAVAAVKGTKVDLVLMDLELPGMSGMDAAREIRQWERCRAGTDSGFHHPLCIVAMTAHTDDKLHQDCIDAGMNAVSGKRINPDMLEQHMTQSANMVQAA